MSSAVYKRVFGAKKRVHEQTRYFRAKEIVQQISGLSSFESLGLPECDRTPAVLPEVI
jgi:hypothetical protein